MNREPLGKPIVTGKEAIVVTVGMSIYLDNKST
jgi:hypothetical protein